jgi:hypothetical protein
MKRPKQHLHEVGNLVGSQATACSGWEDWLGAPAQVSDRDDAPAHVREHDVHHAIKLVGRFVNRLWQTARRCGPSETGPN